MSDILEQRINIQNEEVGYRSAVSENLFGKTGAAINFINKRQFDQKSFEINGPYKVQTAVDGAFIVPYDMEIIGVAAFNIEPGSSGYTEFDIRRYTSSGVNAGSIFSTRPAIFSSAGGYAFVARRTDLVLENPAGTQLPVISTTNINAGDMLVCDLTAIQNGGQNCGLILWYRPR